MKNYNLKESFRVESPVRMETTYGILDHEDKATLEVTVAVDTKANYGYFELYDIESEGDRFYGSGGLWFDGKELVDYDGVFELSNHVVEKLKEWGFDTSYVD